MNNLDPVVYFFELPLYTPIQINQENIEEMWKLFNGSHRINYYNPTLGENSTYEVSLMYNRTIAEFYGDGGWAYGKVRCVRTSEEYYVYSHFDKKRQVLLKIGQYPSIAAFHISKIKQYNKVLSKERLKEFTRAIGLAANGVGIGSFVYLRRIFEELIEEAHSKAQSGQGWDEATYGKSRMGEKIGMLQEHLPAFLVEHKSLYGILSKGVHSLSEEECLAHFDTVKVGIELILDEKAEAEAKRRKLEDAKQRLNALSNKMSG